MAVGAIVQLAMAILSDVGKGIATGVKAKRARQDMMGQAQLDVANVAEERRESARQFNEDLFESRRGIEKQARDVRRVKQEQDEQMDKALEQRSIGRKEAAAADIFGPTQSADRVEEEQRQIDRLTRGVR